MKKLGVNVAPERLMSNCCQLLCTSSYFLTDSQRCYSIIILKAPLVVLPYFLKINIYCNNHGERESVCVCVCAGLDYSHHRLPHVVAVKWAVIRCEEK